MSLYSQFATDQKAEQEGVWVEYSAEAEGLIPGFKIARMTRANKRYAKALERATRPHRRAMKIETFSNEAAEKLVMEVFCETVLLDWRNVQTRDGTPIPFNKSNAVDLFTDLPELYDDLSEHAKNATLFRETELEEDSKN